jgi:putative flippase GtrA
MAVDDVELDTGGAKARAFAKRLPRPVRFMIVGCAGLVTDLCVFTVIAGFGHHPLAIRLVSLGVATLVTWRLNRMLTFARSNRAQSDEAMRYLAVTAVAQGTSYAVFATLVLTALAALPQAALLSGGAVGALVSYNGHRLFAFAPRAASSPTISGDIAPEGPHHI